MSLLFMDSMSHYATADIAKKWTAVGPGSGATLTVNPTGGRRGGGCLTENSTNFMAAYPVSYAPSVAPSTSGALGVAVKIVNISAAGLNPGQDSAGFLSIAEGSAPHIRLYVTNAGTLAVYAAGNYLGPTSQLFTEGEWVHLGVEWVIHGTTGRITIYSGSRSNVVFNAENINTRWAISTGVWNSVSFFKAGNYSYTASICDFYLLDALGTRNNQYLGDRTVNAFPVVDDGFHVDSVPSAGSDRFEMLNDATPDGDTTNTVFAAPGADTYKVAAMSPTAVIDGIQLCTAAKKVGDGSATMAARWRQANTDHDTAEKSVASDDYLYYCFPLDENPETAAAFAVSQFGPSGSGEIGVVKAT